MACGGCVANFERCVMKAEKSVMSPVRKAAIIAIAAALAGSAAAEAVADPIVGSNATVAAAPAPPPTAPVTRPSAVPATSTAAARVDLIRRAPDLSSAIGAYTAAEAAQPGNLDVEEAYVRRMVDLNAPEL